MSKDELELSALYAALDYLSAVQEWDEHADVYNQIVELETRIKELT